jgi:glycosyltransferase involved in cell wall biosynthesis
MTFSVIIPVYNAEKYIAGALEPVIEARKVGFELEVILVENGSEDKSGELCDKYAQAHDYIRAEHFGKIGAFRARLEGMKLATGDYFVFADSDDELSTDVFKELTACYESYTSQNVVPDIIIYNAADFDNRDSKMFSFPFEEGRVYSGADKKVFYEIMSTSDAINAMWNKAVRRDFVRKTDSFEGLKLNHGEDLLQTAEFIDKAETIVYIDKALYYYNQNSAGLTGSFHREYLGDQIQAWEAFDKYVEKWHKDDADIWDALRKRKTLTCAIAVNSLIYSDVKAAERKELLRELMDTPFYKEYVEGELPDWAPEENEYVYRLMKTENPFKALNASARKSKLRRTIKKILS